jgi:5'-nucleotidase
MRAPTARHAREGALKMAERASIVPSVILLSLVVTCFVGCNASTREPSWLAGAPDVLLPHAPATLQALQAAPAPGCQDHAEDDEPAELRARAARPVGIRTHSIPQEREVAIKLLALNDFHGQLSSRSVDTRPAGGAAVLAAYLSAAAAGAEHSFIVHAGDHVGASPPNSALLQDEPAIAVLDALANDACSYEDRRNPACNLVGTFGNHEFDEGKDELLRLIHGGDHPSGPFLGRPWRGARFPYVSANVVDADTGEPIVAPYVVKQAGGVPVAFVGAVLEETPTVVTPTGVAGLRFLDEADAINRYVSQLRAEGVRTFIVTIHQGLTQARYTGPTSAGAAAPSGPLLDVIERLDDDVDVVVSGHTHQFTNAVMNNVRGVPLLVTQAFSAGTAYGEIDLIVDRDTRDVVSKTGQIVTTWADEGPGLTPHPRVSELVAQADASVATRVQEVVAEAAVALSRAPNEAGESALGNLIADAQRASLGSDFAVMNPGGIRADLAPGSVSWGALFAVQPFGNSLVELTLTGQQIYELLDQQWGGAQPAGGRILQISGFSYTWDASVPEGGRRVLEVRADGNPIARDVTYTLAANSFIAAGGDNFSVLTAGANQVGGEIDLDALIAHVRSLPQPFLAALEGRIQRR